MKAVTIIFFTFLIAFLTTSLFEIDFIAINPVRYTLVVLLVAIELCAGIVYLFHQLKNLK